MFIYIETIELIIIIIGSFCFLLQCLKLRNSVPEINHGMATKAIMHLKFCSKIPKSSFIFLYHNTIVFMIVFSYPAVNSTSFFPKSRFDNCSLTFSQKKKIWGIVNCSPEQIYALAVTAVKIKLKRKFSVHSDSGPQVAGMC